MDDLTVTRTVPGVSIISSADPYSTLAIHRISRDHWEETPAEPGVYMLWGVVGEKAAINIGMSTTDMRKRIRQHHVSERKAWFGTSFATPRVAALFPAVEAELLQKVGEADVVGLVENRAMEARFLNADVEHDGHSNRGKRRALPKPDRSVPPATGPPYKSSFCARGQAGRAQDAAVRRASSPDRSRSRSRSNPPMGSPLMTICGNLRPPPLAA